MRYEHTITRPDKTRYKIDVRFYLGRNDAPTYDIVVSKCDPGKRKFMYVHDSDNYQYRGLSMEQREKARNACYLEYVTPDEIHEAQLALWEKLKPVK
jgi:hypothetical protein